MLAELVVFDLKLMICLVLLVAALIWFFLRRFNARHFVLLRGVLLFKSEIPVSGGNYITETIQKVALPANSVDGYHIKPNEQLRNYYQIFEPPIRRIWVHLPDGNTVSERLQFAENSVVDIYIYYKHEILPQTLRMEPGSVVHLERETSTGVRISIAKDPVDQ